jgi:RNA 2',3'-cyclic 3'-phosphodiesterase
VRLFVAVDLPAAVKDAVAAIIEQLRPAAPEAKWVGRDNLHVTLAFLGETPLVDEVGTAVSAAARTVAPFTSRLGGTGTFPSARRARVVWIGLGGEPHYAAAAEAVWKTLAPLGFEAQRRPFTAHLTIARLRTPAPFDAEADVPALEFPVEALTLFRSRLARPAPFYEPQLVAPLTGPAHSAQK